jgi:hypothetical protein
MGQALERNPAMKKLLAGAAALVVAILTAPAHAAGQEAAEVTLVHGIPGAPVDVVVDGEVLVENFEPGTVQDISALAGETLQNVEVRAAGTTDVVIGPLATFDVPTGSASVVAHLDATGAPTITVFENDTTTLAGGTGRLTIRHTAAAPAVDLVVGDARPVAGAENGDSASLDLIAGEMAGLQLAPAGGTPIADVPPLMLDEGANLIVYVVGSLDEDTLTFFTEERSLDMDDTPLTMGEGLDDDETGETGEGGTSDPTAEMGEDGTPAPTAVNTGSALTSSSSGVLYLGGALGLSSIALGALALRRRAARP